MGGYIGPGIATQVDGYTQSQTDAKLTPTNVSDKDNNSTGAFDLPSGTTAQRPSNPNSGYTRFNTSIGAVETWNGTAWVTSGGLVLQAVQTASFTAVAGNSYPVNTTSAAITVTLPASPTAGQKVGILDYAGTAATNPIIINPNGGNINGIAAGAVVSTTRASMTLVFVDSTQGWVDVSVGNSTYLPQNYSASYLIVAGGGGGGEGYQAGGGGAGGLLSGSLSVQLKTNYVITVGAGGAGGIGVSGTSTNKGNNGSNSTVFGLTCVGGGGGASYWNGSGNAFGVSGGSGGGAACAGATSSEYGGSGTTGQGYAGGSYNGSYVSPYSGGGGGGAGGVGANGGGTTGNGGVGLASSITGSSIYYAGGGGGGTYYSPAGTGGSGGGGAGSVAPNAPGAGSSNTGGGGGGSGATSTSGGNGGSGVVILSVPTINYSGVTTGSPAVTTSGSNTILTFTSSGSYTA